MPPLNQTPNQPNLAATRPARKVVSLSICSWLKKMNRLCRWSAFFKSMCTDFSQRTTAARPRSFFSRLARQKQDGVILPLLIKELLVQHFLKTHFSASPIRSVHSLRYSPFSSKRRLSQPIDCCNVMFALVFARVCSRVSMDCCNVIFALVYAFNLAAKMSFFCQWLPPPASALSMTAVALPYNRCP